MSSDVENVLREKRFEYMNIDQLVEILGITIKKDNENKIITFACMLAAYTKESQFNISFNAPSSTGKSYIPLEIATLFPKEDVIKLGGCSPAAFYHEQGFYDKERNSIIVDLSRKIIIFLDQPNNLLLERLRSLLSHDEKEITSKITDKSERGGNRTKTVIIVGFPSVIFCSAGLMIDEQEGTRFLLLSPQSSEEKIRESVHERVKRDSDSASYYETLNRHPLRNNLKERISAIKEANISSIIIPNPELIESRFFQSRTRLKAKDSREIGRVTSLIKSFALLNLWFREVRNEALVANEEDIIMAFDIWSAVSESQSRNIPPYIYGIHKEVILPIYREKNEGVSEDFREGVTRGDVLKRYLEVYGEALPEIKLRQQILPMLEQAGLIVQEEGVVDKRIKLIKPTPQEK